MLLGQVREFRRSSFKGSPFTVTCEISTGGGVVKPMPFRRITIGVILSSVKGRLWKVRSEGTATVIFCYQ